MEAYIREDPVLANEDLEILLAWAHIYRYGGSGHSDKYVSTV